MAQDKVKKEKNKEEIKETFVEKKVEEKKVVESKPSAKSKIDEIADYMYELHNKGKTGFDIKNATMKKFNLTEKDISIFQPKGVLNVSYKGETRAI